MFKNNQDHEALIQAVLTLQSPKEAKAFLRDLLTETELQEFAHRWVAARMLAEGIPYTEIQAKTGLSSRTVARISKWLHKGMNGYKKIIARTHHHSLPSKKVRD